LTPREEFEIHIQEFILNASMEDVLGGDTDEFTPSYNELKRVLLKVLLFLHFVLFCLKGVGLAKAGFDFCVPSCCLGADTCWLVCEVRIWDGLGGCDS